VERETAAARPPFAASTTRVGHLVRAQEDLRLQCARPSVHLPLTAVTESTPGEEVVAGRTEARCRHNWPLPGHTTILDRRLAGTGHSPLCYTPHKRRVKNACCKRMFQVFQTFQMYVASVLDGCYKSKSGCCICYNCCTHMLQASVPNVSAVFIWMLHVFHLDVAYVAVVIHVCYKCILQMFHLLHMYIAIVLYGCYICSSNYTHMLQAYVSYVCCSKCCSPRDLTRGHTRAARTQPMRPISVMQTSSNSRTCTQWVVSVQTAEHILIKVHACMQSAKEGQRN
jgi:hypothetical protein